jgi:hypothetical protein
MILRSLLLTHTQCGPPTRCALSHSALRAQLNPRKYNGRLEGEQLLLSVVLRD